GLARNEGPLKLLFGNPVSVYLGEISYSIYMVHWFFIANWKVLGFDPEQPERTIVSVLGGTLLLSSLTYKFVEQPSRKWLRRKFFNPVV
ncbi:MAG: hypothetical protein OEU86_08440, partial [Gammaproteobacteria bacterium]|nr:hypothetical protein [Gammaproteobacteria bacterium]